MPSQEVGRYNWKFSAHVSIWEPLTFWTIEATENQTVITVNADFIGHETCAYTPTDLQQSYYLYFFRCPHPLPLASLRHYHSFCIAPQSRYFPLPISSETGFKLFLAGLPQISFLPLSYRLWLSVEFSFSYIPICILSHADSEMIRISSLARTAKFPFQDWFTSHYTTYVKVIFFAHTKI